MEDFSGTFLLIDASPLISFLKLARFDLLEVLNAPLACTDFVRAEVQRPREALETLLASQKLQEIPLTDPALLLEVEQLYGQGLGRGEASSIVLAQQQGYGLIIDDKKARKEASKRQIILHSTAEIVVQNIQMGNLTLSEADGFIVTWRSLAEFPVSCRTFKDLMG